jgi:hypothetical protein
MPPSVTVVPGSTRKLYQLTGEFDRERQALTLNRTETRFRLVGTDLGASFEHGGHIYFLFGDSNATTPPDQWRPFGGDAIAHTTDRNPLAGIRLEFIRAPDEGYLSPQVPGISLGPFEVPTGGFSTGPRLYVFFTTDSSGGVVMGRSVLASSTDNGRTFDRLYDVSRSKFINVAPVLVNNRDVPGMPGRTGRSVLCWASGPYRQSDPYLAYIPVSGVDRRSSWRYFTGMDPVSGLPRWSAAEADAVPLFQHACIGELSVAWLAPLGVWLMLYNCDTPRGIVYRVAEHPWGPWSDAAVLFDPFADGGYCHFIHRSWEAGACDSVHDPGRENEWGGEYGPYVIAPYTTGDAAATSIFFVMSTWNPYNTVLMTARLRGEADGQPVRVVGVPSLIQSRYGVTGNFELISPVAGGGLAHLWRDNDAAALPWYGPVVFGQSGGQYQAASLIQSNFGSPGNLEVVAQTADTLHFFWADMAGWHGPFPMVADGAAVSGTHGNPSLIQATYGGRGNFELLVPRTAGGLAHYWRDNDDPSLPWHGPILVAPDAGRFDAVTLIQSNFGSPGNLEAVARAGDRLFFLWRDGNGWHGPFPLVADGVAVAGATGNPSLIQGRFGVRGNFEALVPSLAGGCAMYWRDNDDPALPWHGPVTVGAATAVDAVSLIQSNFGSPGNLEVVARAGEALVFAWRDSSSELRWSGFAPITPV